MIISFTHIIIVGLFFGCTFYAVGNEAENSSHPQQQRESSEQVFAELDPFRSLLGGR